MRIGFFGGSFDPPHLGHLAVARAAATAFSLEKVLFVPTALQPLKPEGAVAPFSDRLAMVHLLCDAQPATATPLFEPSSLDAPLPDLSPNYTVDTLTRLRNALDPSDRIFAIVGADAFMGLPHWRSASTLLELADWIVVSRPGFALQQLHALALPASQMAGVHLLPGVAEHVSATAIRELLRQGSVCAGLLSPPVLGYIRDHALYGT